MMCGAYPSTNSFNSLDQMEFVLNQQAQQGVRSDGRPSQNLGVPQVQGAIDAAREVEKKREEEAAAAAMPAPLNLPPIVAQALPVFTATPAPAPVTAPTSPYSTTVTTAPAPAAAAIAPEKRKATSSLKIAAGTPAMGAGTGLNIGI